MNGFAETESSIRQLHARFVDAVWRQDAQAFAQCFAQAGEWKIAGLHFRGRSQIEEMFGKLLGVCERVALITGTPLLDTGDTEVTSRTPITELAKLADGSSAMTLGIYYDRYAEEDGRWLFAWRHWTMHYRGPIDLSGAFAPTPDYGPPPNLPGADEATYVRPK